VSTELGIVRGRTEQGRAVDHEYKESELYITSFNGGGKGVMIQLTPSLGTDYIQLDYEGVFKLLDILIAWREDYYAEK